MTLTPGFIQNLPANAGLAALRAGAAALLLALLAPAALAAPTSANTPQPQALIDAYIDAWVAFYPSRAFAYGRQESAADFENYSATRVQSWQDFNATTAGELRTLLATTDVGGATRTDLGVLLAQAEDELADWREDQPLTQQPHWYAEQISQAMTHLLVRDQLDAQARSTAALQRLRGVQRLSRQGVAKLVGGNALRTRRALQTLSAAREYYDGGLRDSVSAWPVAAGGEAVVSEIAPTVAALSELEAHIQGQVMPVAVSGAAIGSRIYAAKLARRTSGRYTPDRLLAEAGEDMRTARGLMFQEAMRWASMQPDGAERFRLTELTDAERLDEAISAMEADRQSNSADFLQSFIDLTAEAERFVAVREIASIPKPTTLLIALSPSHFSGAAVGGVYPSGPFDPQADTLFYIPSVPDSAAAEAREAFYRSFNTHFNTMILAHEMFPGHYLQYKVAVSEAPALRSLYPNGSYVEGWGSFVEELMLDEGWAGDAPLTRLAHLRKRLENATRAYVSVQVNTAAWDEAEVLRFAREEGLLAPQFASNLWQRVVNSPLQITDYFTGFKAFKELFVEFEQRQTARKPDERESLQSWVDSVLRAGPVPLKLLKREL